MIFVWKIAMTVKTFIKSTLISAIVVMSIGGLFLHLRIHPFAKNPSNLVPVITGFMSIIAVPLLFSFKRTASYAYVLNGMLVIIGTVTMGHFSIAHFPNEITVSSMLLNTLLGDILILWGVFFIGKAIFDLEFFGDHPDMRKTGKSFRYPNYGWWAVHLAAISFVYALGHMLWS